MNEPTQLMYFPFHPNSKQTRRTHKYSIGLRRRNEWSGARSSAEIKIEKKKKLNSYRHKW